MSENAVYTDSTRRLHLAHVFPSFAVGGSQSRLAQLMGAVPERYRHTIIALDGNYEMAPRLPSTAMVEFLAPRVPKNSSPATWRRIRTLLRELKPDLLLTYNWGAMDWCLVNRFCP